MQKIRFLKTILFDCYGNKMRTKKEYSNWMAGEIAKTYLLATGLPDIIDSDDKKFDYLAI